MVRLQQELSHTFAATQVQLNVAPNELTVVLENSPLGELDSLARAKAAREVAEFVRDHYLGYAALKTVRVGFGVRTGLLARTRSTYVFETSALGAPRTTGTDSAGAPPVAAREAYARHLLALNRRDTLGALMWLDSALAIAPGYRDACAARARLRPSAAVC